MKKDQKHIRQKLTDNYPKPEVPVEGAWLGMEDLLNSQAPVSHSIIDKLSSFKTLVFGIPAVLVGIALSIHLLVPGKEKQIPGKISRPNVETGTAYVTKQPATLKSEEEKRTGKISRLPRTTPGISPENKADQPDSLIATNKIPGKKATSNARKNIIIKTSHPAGISSKARKPKISSESGKRVSGRTERSIVIHKNPKSTSASNFLGSESYNENIAGASSGRGAGRSKRPNALTDEKGKGYVVPEAGFEDVKKNVITPSYHEPIAVSVLTNKSGNYKNMLEGKLGLIHIQPGTRAEYVKSGRRLTKAFSNLKDLHFGLQWSSAFPPHGYANYFTVDNNKNQYFTSLLPGIWAKKTLTEKSQVLVRVSPFSQHFAGNKLLYSNEAKVTDSTSYLTKIGVVKTSGFNAGIQFNQQIYGKLHVAIGANLQWQQRGLLSREITTPYDSSRIVSHEALFSVKQTSNEAKYLNLYFVTSNFELFYAWRNFQIGGGIVIPVTSMTTSKADSRLRPASGQLFLRWRLK